MRRSRRVFVFEAVEPEVIDGDLDEVPPNRFLPDRIDARPGRGTGSRRVLRLQPRNLNVERMASGQGGPDGRLPALRKGGVQQGVEAAGDERLRSRFGPEEPLPHDVP